MNWLYAHLPHLYAETWLPQFHTGEPVALIRDHNHLIEDANDAAKACGVDVDMSLNTAFCLCPGLQVTPRDPCRQQRALERAAVIASRYSAWLGLDAADGLYLEIASMKRLLGGVAQIQHRLQLALQQMGYSAVIAVAPQPKAARLLARAGQHRCCDQEQLIQALADIPFTALGIEAKTELRLAKLGLATVQDLVQLPSGDLSYRVDAELTLYLDQISGRKPWLPPPFKAAERFHWYMDLEQEFESLEPLRFYLAQGVGQFCRFLQKRCLAAQVLRLKLQHRHRAPSCVDIKLANIDNRPESWQYMLNSTVNRLELAAPITAMQLSAALFEPLDDRDLHLFNNVSQECDQKKTQLLNRLSARLGIHNVHFLQISTDPRPEFQTICASQPAAQAQRPAAALVAPLWLLPQPQPVAIDRYIIQRGPVRLTSGWWDRNAAHRDYYVAGDSGLTTQWLFRDSDGTWYQHGWFA
ncbi:DNA polymerase Y family protein [Exilibacterium tricleocarpae]|uniref:DNA polymerase Y family protein n=1 Tax=Exilibacterium tricleocarpae TaxID=2591008 RepID=A0A545SQR0_9GAMM|nr:DNA polymerase Y family protein [Exilibacterium tricleocarpae]TQV67292.1 DNA polymerase Y family protein [Exilibacterium tricleocarpae]